MDRLSRISRWSFIALVVVTTLAFVGTVQSIPSSVIAVNSMAGDVNLGDGGPSYTLFAADNLTDASEALSPYIAAAISDGTVKSHQKISDTEGGFTGTLNDVDNFGDSITRECRQIEDSLLGL